MRSRLGLILCVFSLLVTLAGCGSSDGGGATPPPTSNNPPPPPPPPPPVIGADGGTVTEASGASVIVPAGAIDTDTTIRVAMDSTGAPALPSGLIAAGNTYVVTPHGGAFAQPVEVSIPAPNVTLQPNQLLKLAKAHPGGEWEVLEDSTLSDGRLSASVTSFSFFMGVVVTYPLPIAQAEPFRVTTNLSCGDKSCTGVYGPVTATYTVTGNGGALPANCVDDTLSIRHLRGWGTMTSPGSTGTSQEMPIDRSGGALTLTLDPNHFFYYSFGVGMRCNGYWSPLGRELAVTWPLPPLHPRIIVASVPAQLDVVEGRPASLDAVLHGGASGRGSVTSAIPPTQEDRAIIDWQRSDDSGASWRVVARSYENEANPLPYGTGVAWRPWSVRHGFIATATDQGALIRVHACYTPPDVAAPPCVFSAATLINVLQQSALPAIVNAPRSLLLRTGQTANLSATASGLPAPTLQWQTRPANSSEAWSDVVTGSGATTGNYITAPLTLGDNGAQYRVVATNSLGSVESAAVTVSVSDLDVAPTITTQPGSLSVTAGSDAVFAIAATGTEALSYQWRFNGTAIAGANSAVLRLDAVNNANAGSYSVTVSNDAGAADSNAAVLTVSPGTPAVVAPTIVTQPSAVTANVGNTATFAVGVDGSGPFTFQWRKDGANIPGATSAVLTFNSVALLNAGTYSVVVSNSAGAIVSNNTTLDVAPASGAAAPTITSQPATLIVPAGGSGILAVGATGSGPLSYQWTFEGVAIPGGTLPVLSLTNVSNAHVGSYAVAVSNSISATSSQSVNLILLGAPAITQQPVATTAIAGETATFSVAASGSDLRYTWMVNDAPIAGATAASYTTPMLVGANTGAVYSVIVYNGAGLVFSQGAVLTVQTIEAPSIVQHPANVTIEPGLQAEMCVTIAGTPTFDLLLQRWNGAAWVSGASVLVNSNTSVCYFTDVLTLADNGAQFRFLVENPAGQIASNTATVTVQTASTPVVTATTLASRATSGATANNRSYDPTLSADGNLVAFMSDGTNLVPGFGSRHGYVRNLLTGVTTAVNQMPNGAAPSLGISQMKLAAGGRYVVFSTLAPGITADDTNDSLDVFRRDLQTGTTERLTVLQDGSQLTGAGNANGDMRLDISADGRYIIFASQYDFSNTGALLPQISLFLRDTQSDQTRIVVANPSYAIGYAALSSGGEYIAYALSIGNPVPAPVHVYDVEASTTATLFTLDQSTNADYLGQGLSISGNGRYVAFALRSQPLLGSTVPQVVVIDRDDPATLMIASTGSAGSGMGNGTSNFPKLSDDGRYVVFSTRSSNISGNVGNSLDWALMLRDLQTQTTTVASRRANGAPVRTAGSGDHLNAISGDGSVVGFTANQTDMEDGNIEYQVYVAPRP